jgi:hypothetical protein
MVAGQGGEVMERSHVDLLAPSRDDIIARLTPRHWHDGPSVWVALAIVAWLPLLCLSLVAGTALGSTVARSFLADVSMYARYLVALPLFLGAEMVIRQRLESVVVYFKKSEILTDSDRQRFVAEARRLSRRCDAAAAEIILIVLAYLGAVFLAAMSMREGVPTWFDNGSGTLRGISPAGWWHTVISQPIWIFLLLRWGWRLLLWWRFLAGMAGLDLRLLTTHPDRAGGLGILEMGQKSFVYLTVGTSSILAGNLAIIMRSEGVTLAMAMPTVAVHVLICVLVIVGPLFHFTGPLRRAKRRGLVEYGELGDELFRAFEERWTPMSGRDQRSLLGKADPSSLADYGYAYEVASTMRLIPFSRQGAVFVAAMALAPFSPLLLINHSVTEILQRLLGIVG